MPWQGLTEGSPCSGLEDAKEWGWRSRRRSSEILSGWGAGFAELLGRGTALVLAPVNTVHFQGKCNLKATQAIQDIWYIMVNNKMFSSVQLALEKREG